MTASLRPCKSFGIKLNSKVHKKSHGIAFLIQKFNILFVRLFVFDLF